MEIKQLSNQDKAPYIKTSKFNLNSLHFRKELYLKQLKFRKHNDLIYVAVN